MIGKAGETRGLRTALFYRVNSLYGTRSRSTMHEVKDIFKRRISTIEVRVISDPTDASEPQYM